MDLGVATSEPVTREFLAVVIAGFGNELVPLTSNHGVEPCPKALVPVANKPMIDYVLSWIEQAGVKDVLLICPSIHRPMISHHVHSGLSTLRIDVQTYDESPESNTGTCTLLRHFATRISEDFIVLPCDFIPPPSLSLSSILNKYRAESVSDGSVATTCWFAAHQPEKNSLVEDWGTIPPPVPMVWDEPTGTLLQVETPDDLDRNSDEMELRMSLLSQYGYFILSVLDLLQEKKHFDSFREEFIPWLCKVQYQRKKREKYGATNMYIHQSDDADASSPFDPESTISSSSLRVGLVLHSAKEGFATRVNNIHSLLDMNRRLLAETTYSLPTDPQNRSLIDPKAQISSDTIIGSFTQVSERTTIKKSVVGKHCVIGKMVDGCILGKNTKVGAKAELTRCVTQAGYEVASEGGQESLKECFGLSLISYAESVKNEKLDVSDWTAGPDESEEEEEEESDGDTDEEEDSSEEEDD
ncbi:UDP-3-O-glucosamine N-acyltransferase [Gymnopus androsaceus JB14]|uniref:Translation initiation factor eIF2B subunit gamma n=1 Tax=Gymnopus androsaceus JB14 TaxID=1447944 RepID=A0A6A4HB17_9AGAR|nr:UDP-3-O-glucosamine N-acyltransferase [Gymnopus androsaceus JB14]